MTILDRIKELSKSRDKTVKEVAIELGLGENYLYSLKHKIPNGQTLQKLADYFNVSVDYLLGREEMEEPQFSPELLEALDNAEGYSGQPIDDHDKEIIKGLLAGYFAGKNKK